MSTDGLALRLEDAMDGWVRGGICGTVRLTGAAGMGKATALAHWKSEGAPGHLTMLEPNAEELHSAAERGLVLYASQDADLIPTLGELDMAPWGADEVLEYLLARHPSKVRALTAHFSSTTLSGFLNGCPELIAGVLDRLAADSELQDPKQALREFLYDMVPGSDCARFIGEFSLRFWDGVCDKQMEAGLKSAPFLASSRMTTLLRRKVVRTLLAADRALVAIDEGDWSTLQVVGLRPGLIREVAYLLDRHPRSQELLRLGLDDPEILSLAVPVSILHGTSNGWAPYSDEPILLTGAILPKADWHGAHLDDSTMRRVNLRGANLRGVHLGRVHGHFSDLSGADLTQAQANKGGFGYACFHEAVLDGADFSNATFYGGDLTGMKARGANFQGALFMQANLRGACLIECDLSGADLRWSDLRETDLKGSHLVAALLEGCKLQGAQVRKARLPSANLAQADLTGAQFAGAMLWRADLSDAKLADVCFAGANLRNVDFTGAIFQRGSTREGLVLSKPPMWGSLTGFYSGDSSGLDSHSPEEIRTANFCRADLREAEVHGTDWYLVDLRAALYDSEQAKHFGGCGAILT